MKICWKFAAKGDDVESGRYKAEAGFPDVAMAQVLASFSTRLFAVGNASSGVCRSGLTWLRQAALSGCHLFHHTAPP